jgi:hypothetical protein
VNNIAPGLGLVEQSLHYLRAMDTLILMVDVEDG